MGAATRIRPWHGGVITVRTRTRMKRAIKFAVSRGVICVSSAGNNGTRLRVYPAAFYAVLGVGSTNNLDARSTFSNFGADAQLAAPGPGGHYAAAWGSSFSAAFVSGGAALLLQVNTRTNEETAADALGNAKELPDRLGLGDGRIDLYRALLSVIRPEREKTDIRAGVHPDLIHRPSGRVKAVGPRLHGSRLVSARTR